MISFKRKRKGAAFLWAFALIGLGFAALMFIIFNNIYITDFEPLAQAQINTTSVLNNVNRISMVWAALPWALVFFFLLFIIAQGQKKFGEI